MGRCAIEIPGDFAPRIERTHGDDGRAWLERLPSLIAVFERRWSLSVGPPFEPLTHSYTAPARDRHGAGVVLKLAVPDRFVAAEIDALRLFDGDGAARLVDSDECLGAMLIERLEPGALLLEVDEREATSVAARLMTRLRRPVPPKHRFHDIWEWMQGLQRLRSAFDGGTGPFPASQVERAEAHLRNPSGEKSGAARRPAPLQHTLGRARALAGHRPQGHRRRARVRGRGPSSATICSTGRSRAESFPCDSTRSPGKRPSTGSG